MSENLIVISISLFVAIAGIVFLVFYHDPLAMPMKLKPKTPASRGNSARPPPRSSSPAHSRSLASRIPSKLHSSLR